MIASALRWARARRVLVLTVSTIAAVIGLIAVRGLTFDADVLHLLPRTGRAVPAFEAFLQRFPNVILWINGHTHTNRVWSHPDPSGRSGGFWEVNTAAHVDYPQQARTVELFDNGDGTLSIVGVMLDHSDAEDISYGPDWDPVSLAAMSLELAANDPALDADFRLGTPSDRNVELLIRKPF